MYSGLVVDFDDPQPDTIDMDDIAQVLSRICRFGGRTVVPYSVAAHAVLVADIAMEATTDRLLALAALHHDDHEAYIGDIVTPLKEQLRGAAEPVAHRLDAAIAAHLGIDAEVFKDPVVKKADFEALWLERDALLPNATEDVWGPHPEITTKRTVPVLTDPRATYLSYDRHLRT